MPKMEWKLKDPKRCDGCLLLVIKHKEYSDGCNMPDGSDCNLHLMKSEYDYNIDRPQSCIDKYGE